MQTKPVMRDNTDSPAPTSRHHSALCRVSKFIHSFIFIVPMGHSKYNKTTHIKICYQETTQKRQTTKHTPHKNWPSIDSPPKPVPDSLFHNKLRYVRIA